MGTSNVSIRFYFFVLRIIQMETLRIWLGSIFFALGVASWLWFFRNAVRPKLNRALLFRKTPLAILFIWNVILIAIGLWIFPIPETIPLVGLILGIIIGLKISK